MQFYENFSSYHAWQVIKKMITDNTESETFLINNTRYYLFYSLLDEVYILQAFIPHSTKIMVYSHFTRQSIANNLVGEAFVKVFDQTSLLIQLQRPYINFVGQS